MLGPIRYINVMIMGLTAAPYMAWQIYCDMIWWLWTGSGARIRDVEWEEGMDEEEGEENVSWSRFIPLF